MLGARPLACLLALTAALAGCSSDTPAAAKPKNPKILSFEASAPTIASGDEVTLTWMTSGAAGVDIEPRIGIQPASGSATDRPFATTTYTLSVPGTSGLTAQVTVQVTGGPPVVTSFTATPRTIAQGDSVTLAWTTINATSVSITPGLAGQPANGSVTVTPSATTTYHLVASNGAEDSAPQELVVVVASGNQPAVRSFSASPQTVAPGEAVTLTWETANATTVTIDNGVGAQATSGSATVHPTETTIYTLTATGNGGNAVASVTVTVVPAGDPEITRFDATPATIAPGGASVLAWDTNDATSVSIDNGVGARSAKGSETVRPPATTTYTLTAFGSGNPVTRQVTVTVASADTPVVTSFTASPTSVLEGGATTLTWTTEHATSVDIDQGVGVGLGPSATIGVTPAQTTTYTLTAHGTSGTATAEVTVTVTAAPPTISAFTAQPASITAGASTTLTWTTDHATAVSIDNGIGAQAASGSISVSPAQATVYTLTATGPGGAATAQVSVSVTAAGAPVIASFTATPQQVAPGSPSTLAWEVTNATAVSIDNGIGTQPAIGSATVSPATTTTYTLSATGPGGTTTAQVTVNVRSATGDRCSDAFEISGSGTFAGDTNTAANDYSAASACTGFEATGPDVVYHLTLQPGDRLQASLAPAGGASWDTSIYLVTGCSDIGASCVAGQDNGNPEVIDYTAATAGDYYLVVDGYSGAGGPYSLSVTLTRAPIDHDTCAHAIDVGTGGTFTGDTRSAHGDYNPGASGCTGFAEAGKDVAYSVHLGAGDRLQARLTTSWDSALYLVRSCSDLTTCVAGSDSGNPETLDHRAGTAGTYYLIVDGFGSAAGTFSLDVTVTPPVTGGDTCPTAVAVPAGGGAFQSTTAGLANDYNPPATCTGFAEAGPDQVYEVSLQPGDVVEASATYQSGLDGALYVVTDCSSLQSCVTGADSSGPGGPEHLRFVADAARDYYLVVDTFDAAATGGYDLTVEPFTGETCATAAPLLTTGQAEVYSTAGKANDYSPNSGGCTSFAEAGPDRVYSAYLRAGDQLQVDLAPTGYDASLYVVSSCADVSGTCLAGSDQSTSGAESVSPVVQQAGEVFVVVDGYQAGGAGTITGHVAHGDRCSDAYRVPPTGGVFNGTTAGYSADYGSDAVFGTCSGFSQSGRDAVYQVRLANGQRLDASLSSSWDSTLYLITDCAHSNTSCLAGQDNGNPETLTWTNSTGSAMTYYLIVDSWLMTGTTGTREGNYTLTVSIH